MGPIRTVRISGTIAAHSDLSLAVCINQLSLPALLLGSTPFFAVAGVGLKRVAWTPAASSFRRLGVWTDLLTDTAQWLGVATLLVVSIARIAPVLIFVCRTVAAFLYLCVGVSANLFAFFAWRLQLAGRLSMVLRILIVGLRRTVCRNFQWLRKCQ